MNTMMSFCPSCNWGVSEFGVLSKSQVDTLKKEGGVVHERVCRQCSSEAREEAKAAYGCREYVPEQDELSWDYGTMDPVEAMG